MGNLTRKKRKRDERSFVVSDSVIVGDRARTEYETSLDAHQQAVGPAKPSFRRLGMLISSGIDWRI